MAVAGIADDDIGKDACAKIVAADLREAVPAVRHERCFYVELLYDISFVAEVLGGVFVKFAFRVCYDKRLSAFCRLVAKRFRIAERLT